MPEYSFWQEFEHCDVIVENMEDVISASVARDDNYNIKVTFQLAAQKGRKTDKSTDDIFYEGIFKAGKPIAGRDAKIPIRNYTINGIIIDNISRSGDVAIYSGTASSFIEHYDTGVVGEAEYSVHWFLNGCDDMGYNQGIKISGNEYEKITWGSFATDEFKFDTNMYCGWDAIKLKYKDFELLFGRVKKSKNKPRKASFIRTQNKQEPTANELKEVCLLLSYILGVELIHVGSTKYNRESSPIFLDFRSTFRKDIESIIDRHELPPIPIRLSDVYALNKQPCTQINKFIETYLIKKQDMGLQTVIWYLNYARSQHPLVKIQPLSTAFDMLCTAYYATSDNTHVPPYIFKDIMKDIKPIVNRHLPDKRTREMLIGKFNYCNSVSINKRNKAIFQELGMELSDLEIRALNSRNKSIHGFESEDYVTDIINANTYTTVVNRLLLALLGMEHYIDYSRLGMAINTVNMKQGGQFNVRKLY